MEDLLLDLEHAAKTPAKQRAVKINALVDKICSDAYENGLSTEHVSRIIDVVTSTNALDPATIGALIRNLYPIEKVPDVVVINIVAGLGHGNAKPGHNVQAALLKWLIMVYGVLENQRTLSQLYAVLFNLLDTLALRTPLCHILSLITRRKHVRPYRIQLLMELTRQFGGSDAPLVGLLRVYKDYYPDVIVREAVAGRAKVFTHPNEEWRQRLLEIQDSNAARVANASTHNWAFQSSKTNGSAARRTRNSIIPTVQTSNASELSVTLEEIDNVSDFVQKLEKIEPPNQLVAVISDPLLQKYLQLRNSAEHVMRIDSWLLAFFEERLGDVEDNTSQILSMLDSMVEYTRSTKSLPDACATYLRSMLPSWNGVTGRATVIELLSYISPKLINSFAALKSQYLRPLEDALFSSEDNTAQVIILNFYTTLLQRWTTTILAEPEIITDTSSKIQDLIEHAILLTLVVTQSNASQVSESTILSFYEALNSLFSDAFLTSKIRIIIPPSQLIYNLQFSSSLTTLDRLCAILASYKTAFEAATAHRNDIAQGTTLATMPSYSKEYLNLFNGYLMDICNCLWRGKALQTKDANALGCMIDGNVTAALTKYVTTTDALTMPWLFSFSTSPVLCFLAITSMRELEDRSEDNIDIRHAGPVTQASLRQLEIDGGLKLSWQDYRLGVLQSLENVGVNGVGSLMYNTMKHLMTARN